MEKRKKIDQIKRMIMFLFSAVIIAALTLLFAYIWQNNYNNVILEQFRLHRRGNWLLYAVYALMIILFSRIYGGFKVGYYKMGDIIYSQFLSNIFYNFLAYLVVCLVGRAIVNPYPMLKLILYDVLIIIAWTLITSQIYIKIFPPRRLIIVYGNHNATNLVKKMSIRSDKYHICEAISIDEDMELIQKRISKYEGVIICEVPGQLRNDILKYCFDNDKRSYITPKISDIIIRGADDIHLFDSPILLCRNNGLTFEQRFMKRCLDLLLSVIATIILLPFFIIVGLMIKLYDGGPVFYTQERVTLDRKVFKIYKFRSMIVNAEASGISIPATDKDPRITPIGRVIRKIRFDEFPQLINIIKGEMSIVGPRPERVEHVQEYSEKIPEFTYRNKVKAGLTGYAQIYGKYNTTAYDKLKLDLMYIENYSLRLDLLLIIMTIKVLFMRESTEGFEEKIDSENQ